SRGTSRSSWSRPRGRCTASGRARCPTTPPSSTSSSGACRADMRLTLIRHGQTPSNVRGLLDTGAPGPGLTALGAAQAAALPRLLDGSPIDGVYVSTLIRTHRTAEPFAAARALDPVELPGVHE